MQTATVFTNIEIYDDLLCLKILVKLHPNITCKTKITAGRGDLSFVLILSYYSEEVKIPFNSEVISDNAMLKINAHHNPSIVIPSIK